jgi:hypothetical protein
VVALVSHLVKCRRQRNSARCSLGGLGIAGFTVCYVSGAAELISMYDRWGEYVGFSGFYGSVAAPLRSCSVGCAGALAARFVTCRGQGHWTRCSLFRAGALGTRLVRCRGSYIVRDIRYVGAVARGSWLVTCRGQRYWAQCFFRWSECFVFSV